MDTENEQRVAEAVEYIRETTFHFFGDESSSEVGEFEASIAQFVQELPSTNEDFENGYWSGNLSISWSSTQEEASLSVESANSKKATDFVSQNTALMYKIIPQLLYIVALVAKSHVYNELSIRGFKNQHDCHEKARPPCLEDVLQAFSKAGYWTRNLRNILISHCHMNAVGDDFELVGEYPESLEELCSYCPSNKGGVESSTI